jgi:hypothetical protein
MSSDFWYRLYFKLRLYEAEGNAFQQLVSNILHDAFPGFVPVAPAGAYGDGGNDGYVPEVGRYFQVYGPRPTTSMRPAAVVRKAKADFTKLLARYPDVRHYSFVLNDRYQGVPADLTDALLEMQAQTGIPCDVVASRNLDDWFMALLEDKRQAILHGVPVDLPQWIDARAVGEVLIHLADVDARFDQGRERAPNFDRKIRFNGLPGAVADRLRSMSYQCGLIDDFLAPRGQHLAQAIAGELNELYRQSQQHVNDDMENAPALRYLWMVDRLIPQAIRPHCHSLKAYREAAEVVLVKKK